jgi:chemotaxis protein MotB
MTPMTTVPKIDGLKLFSKQIEGPKPQMMIRRQTKTENNPGSAPVWLTTFNDLMTLLMVFFVLLFSMGNLDVKRFKHFQNALQSAMGLLQAGQHAPVGILSPEENAAGQTHNDTQEDPVAHHQLEQLDETQGLEAEYTPRGIQLTLNDNLLFQSGSGTITPDGLALLLKISTIIKPFNRNMRVEGHTDNVPISTIHYPSNWELSTERAINVVKFFINEGGIAPRYLSAVGYADSKTKTDNDSALSRSKNRRVEIILGKVGDKLPVE